MKKRASAFLFLGLRNAQARRCYEQLAFVVIHKVKIESRASERTSTWAACGSRSKVVDPPCFRRETIQ